jgi:hypothetical protein
MKMPLASDSGLPYFLHIYSSTLQRFNVKDTVAFWMMTRGKYSEFATISIWCNFVADPIISK